MKMLAVSESLALFWTLPWASKWLYISFFHEDSKGKRPLFCQFVPPLSEEKDKKKPLVSVIYSFYFFPLLKDAIYS